MAHKVRRFGREETSVGEKTGMGNHPVVWPDRHSLDVPSPVKHLKGFGHRESVLTQRPSKREFSQTSQFPPCTITEEARSLKPELRKSGTGPAVLKVRPR